MSKVLVNDENLTNIANAIREKNGTEDTYKPSEMASAIQNIESSSKYAPGYISFYRCNLTDITDELSNLDTSNVTYMKEMFTYAKLKSLDLSNFDTSNATDMTSMFEQMTALTSLDISNFNMSKVTKIGYMFSGMTALTSLEVPNINTNLITSISGVFYGLKLLVSLNLGHWDLSNINDISNTFYNLTSLENLIFPQNFGAGFNTSKSANYSYYNVNLSTSNSLTHDSLMSVINNLYDIASLGCNVQSLTIGSTNLAKLTEDEIAIATNKGWNVT